VLSAETGREPEEWTGKNEYGGEAMERAGELAQAMEAERQPMESRALTAPMATEAAEVKARTRTAAV
jgi:hypothetical protein